MTLWLLDPKTKERSVSLTLLVGSGVVLAVCGILQVLGKTQSVGPFSEMFYSCTALYFSRRLTISGKNYSSDPATQIEGKLE